MGVSCKFSAFPSFLVLQYGLKICMPIANILENKNKVVVNDAQSVHCRLNNTRIEKDYEEMAKVFLCTNKELPSARHYNPLLIRNLS